MNREDDIAFEMNYCQHYGRGKGVDMLCKAGMDLKTIQSVPTGEKGFKWGPCIGGHTLPNPHELCPHWIRRTRKMGEDRADALEGAMQRIAIAAPVVGEWRKKLPIGKAEVIECPVCKGRLHLSQAACNGHIHAKCETEGCLSWME